MKRHLIIATLSTAVTVGGLLTGTIPCHAQRAAPVAASRLPCACRFVPPPGIRPGAIRVLQTTRGYALETTRRYELEHITSGRELLVHRFVL
jgi:hypothetical protein